jgi:hypothetical protein
MIDTLKLARGLQKAGMMAENPNPLPRPSTTLNLIMSPKATWRLLFLV